MLIGGVSPPKFQGIQYTAGALNFVATEEGPYW